MAVPVHTHKVSAILFAPCFHCWTGQGTAAPRVSQVTTRARFYPLPPPSTLLLPLLLPLLPPSSKNNLPSQRFPHQATRRPTVFPSHCNPLHSTPLRWPASAACRPPSATCRLGPVNPPPVAEVVSNCILNIPYLNYIPNSGPSFENSTALPFTVQLGR